MEYFKDIPGYEGLYQVSNYGRIASVKREKILRPVESKRFKYNVVTLCRSGATKIHRIHRLVLRTFRGDSKLSVNHIDFNRANNHLSNLEYVSCKENTQHAIMAGPSARRRLTPDQVREIRISAETPRKLSPIYGVPISSIYSILKRQSYADVE